MSVENSARMGTTSSGTGDLDLVPLPGFTPYAGSNAVTYAIWTPLGAYEEGTASVVARKLVGRVVTASSNSNALIGVPQPPAGVVIYISAQIAASGGGAFDDGNYGGIIVSGSGTVVEIADDAVTANTIPLGELPVDRLDGGGLKTVEEVKADLSLPTAANQVILQWHRSAIANGTYAVLLSAKFPFTITEMTHSGSEALTVTPKNGSTNITGLASTAVTTSTATATATAANTFAVSDALNVTVADIATTGDVRLEFLCTRT
jgi:hypothetical protein